MAITVVGSMIAASLLYALGAGLAQPVAQWLEIEAAMDSYRDNFAQRGAF